MSSHVVSIFGDFIRAIRPLLAGCHAIWVFGLKIIHPDFEGYASKEKKTNRLRLKKEQRGDGWTWSRGLPVLQQA